MSANCNYLYTTDGSRWEGGTIQVTHLDGKISKVGPDDLGKIRKEYGRKSVIPVHCVTRSGEIIPMKIDLARAKGRSGSRGQKFEGTYLERVEKSSEGNRDRRDAILKEQLRTLPYGEKNAGAAIERMKVALDQLEHGTVARLLAGLEAPHLISMLGRACAEGTYRPPTPYRGATFGSTGLSSLDALVVRTLLPMAQATLELEGIPLEPLHRFLEAVERTPVRMSSGYPRLDPVDSLQVADLMEMCDDIDVLSLLSASTAHPDRYEARLAKRRFEEVYFAKFGGPGPDPSEYADLPEWIGAAGRRQREQGSSESPQPAAKAEEPTRIDVNELAATLEFKETRKQAKKYAYATSTESLSLMSYAVADKERVVVTVTADGVETSNTALPGDVIMSGPSGELYVVKSKKFATLYEGASGAEVVPNQSPRRVSRYTGDTEVVFTAPWGEDMVLKPGDYLVADGDGFYRVAREEYEKTYNPLDA